eukprot:5870414-Alexandrium_andersonii.AAC.1
MPGTHTKMPGAHTSDTPTSAYSHLKQSEAISGCLNRPSSAWDVSRSVCPSSGRSAAHNCLPTGSVPWARGLWQ